MKFNKNGEFRMNRQEVAEFSLWLNNNPRERYKRFNEVVQSFVNYKQNDYRLEDEWILEAAL
jgi:hypothetical protein